MSACWYRWDGDTLILDVRVQPGARRDEFAGLHAERLKIRLAAPPVDGKANERLVRYLAATCNTPKRRVEVVSGRKSRNKRVLIHRPEDLPEGVRPATAQRPAAPRRTS